MQSAIPAFVLLAGCMMDVGPASAAPADAAASVVAYEGWSRSEWFRGVDVSDESELTYESELVVERGVGGRIRRARGMSSLPPFHTSIPEVIGIELLFAAPPEDGELAVRSFRLEATRAGVEPVVDEVVTSEGCNGDRCQIRWSRTAEVPNFRDPLTYTQDGEGLYSPTEGRYISVDVRTVLERDVTYVWEVHLDDSQELAQAARERADLLATTRAEAQLGYDAWVATHSVEDEVRAVIERAAGYPFSELGYDSRWFDYRFHALANPRIAERLVASIPDRDVREHLRTYLDPRAWPSPQIARDAERLDWATEAVGSVDPYVRAEAAGVLFRSGDPTGVEILLELLRARDVEEDFVVLELATELGSLYGLGGLAREELDRAAAVGRIEEWAARR